MAMTPADLKTLFLFSTEVCLFGIPKENMWALDTYCQIHSDTSEVNLDVVFAVYMM